MKIDTAIRTMNVIMPIIGVVVVWAIFSGNGPLFIGKILITVTALALAVFPPMVDFNETHSTNPDWPPHARFHVVWQVLAQTSSALLAVALIWLLPSTLNFLLAIGLNYIWLFCFLFAMVGIPLYGGSLADPRGVPPIEFKLFGKPMEIDRNLHAVIISTILNTIGAVLVFCS